MTPAPMIHTLMSAEKSARKISKCGFSKSICRFENIIRFEYVGKYFVQPHMLYFLIFLSAVQFISKNEFLLYPAICK